MAGHSRTDGKVAVGGASDGPGLQSRLGARQAGATMGAVQRPRVTDRDDGGVDPTGSVQAMSRLVSMRTFSPSESLSASSGGSSPRVFGTVRRVVSSLPFSRSSSSITTSER